MAKRFLHLGVDFENRLTAPSVDQIEDVLDKATDWFRYAPNCWLIYTAKNPRVWHGRLKDIPGMTDQSYLIFELNALKRSGWMPRKVWDWINESRDP